MSTITLKPANSDIGLGEVLCRTVHADSFRRIDHIRDGMTAGLDLNTAFGKVRSDLDAVHRPATAREETVELKARTAYGDISIRRAVTHPMGESRIPDGP